MRLRLIGRLCIYLLFSIFILRAHTLTQHNLSIKCTCLYVIYTYSKTNVDSHLTVP